MATKVFYRCIETFTKAWIVGKEYECIGGEIITEFGNTFDSDDADDMCAYSPMNAAQFERIERDCFDAHGFEWFRHTPGDPRPCDGDAWIYTLLSGNRLGSGGERYRAQYASWHCKDHKNSDIIGWRYADSAKPEQVDRPITSIIKRVCAEYSEDPSSPQPLSDGKLWPLGGLTFPSPQENDEMMCSDMPLAAMDDGHLTPGQKAYIQAKEDAQAAKQQLAKDAQDKALQERAEQLSDAGKAMDRIDQDHGHRLGWMA